MNRMRAHPDAVAEEPHALEQAAIGDAGGGEDDVLAARQILRPVDALGIGDPHRLAARFVFRLGDDETCEDLAVEAAHGRRREHTFRRTARAHHGVDAAARDRGGDACREVAITDEADARAGGADVGDELLVPRPVEHDHRQFVDLAAERARDGAQVLAHRGIQIDQVLGARPDDQLLHVEVGRMQQAALVRGCEHGDRVGGAGGAQVRAFERIDGDIDLVELAPSPGVLPRQADLLADEEHRRFVALAFTDDDRAVDRHRVEFAAHGFDRRLIRSVPIALTHRVGAGDGGLLDHAEELEREI